MPLLRAFCALLYQAIRRIYMSHPVEDFMAEAIALARENIATGGRPYGAVLVRGNTVIARGVNETHKTADPTAHAELLALRDAGQSAKNPDLQGTVMYASGHPCPMCLAAMYLAGVEAVYFGYGNDDGAPYGLTTESIYNEMRKPTEEQRLPIQKLRPSDEDSLYKEWSEAARN